MQIPYPIFGLVNEKEANVIQKMVEKGVFVKRETGFITLKDEFIEMIKRDEPYEKIEKYAQDLIVEKMDKEDIELASKILMDTINSIIVNIRMYMSGGLISVCLNIYEKLLVENIVEIGKYRVSSQFLAKVISRGIDLLSKTRFSYDSFENSYITFIVAINKVLDEYGFKGIERIIASLIVLDMIKGNEMIIGDKNGGKID